MPLNATNKSTATFFYRYWIYRYPGSSVTRIMLSILQLPIVHHLPIRKLLSASLSVLGVSDHECLCRNTYDKRFYCFTAKRLSASCSSANLKIMFQRENEKNCRARTMFQRENDRARTMFQRVIGERELVDRERERERGFRSFRLYAGLKRCLASFCRSL